MRVAISKTNYLQMACFKAIQKKEEFPRLHVNTCSRGTPIPRSALFLLTSLWKKALYCMVKLAQPIGYEMSIEKSNLTHLLILPATRYGYSFGPVPPGCASWPRQAPAARDSMRP